MSAHCYLLDEHCPLAIRDRLMRLDPKITVHCIGDGIEPPKGTLDPELLSWIESHDCILITNNRSTMPVHLRDHLESGRHIPGIVQLPRKMNIRSILEDLLLISGAALPGEFKDQIVYLPLK